MNDQGQLDQGDVVKNIAIRNIAHRGASAVAPENTFAAFESAIIARASAVEMDLRATADDRVVVMHDETVDRTTNGVGAVAQLTLAEIQQLDAGTWFDARFAGERVPLLEAAVERLGGRVPLVLHIKDAGCGIEQAVAQQVRQQEIADRVTVSSHHRSVLARIRSLVPEVQTTWIVWFRDWRWWMWYVAARVRRLQVDRVGPRGDFVTTRMLRYFHDRGITVRAWGVGRDEQLASRLIGLGIDGMTFDDPARFWELCEAVKETTGDH